MLPAVVALGVASTLLFQLIVGRSLWLDEEMIALNIRDRRLADLAGPLWLGQSAPYGWLVLKRLTVIAFGANDVSVRAVPILFGIGTIAVGFWIGRRWLGPLGTTILVALLGLGTWVALYAVEVKPYSADTFWALLLPALAAWAARPRDSEQPPIARLAVWWCAAALGQWFGNGATLVMPASAIVLAAAMTTRHGWPGLRAVVGTSAVWLAAFGAHYLISMRYTLHSDYLQGYWQFAFPPPDAGVFGTMRWLAQQIKPLALKPGGSEVWAIFWLTAACGLCLLTRARPVLGAALALIPLSAFVAAGLRIVPLYERLALWVIPALYVGVAASADGGLRLLAATARGPRIAARAVGAAILAGALVVSWEIVATGVGNVQPRLHRRAGNHSVDDRAAVQWMTGQLRDGDVILTTKLALPAIWWYSRTSVGPPELGGFVGPVRTPLLEVSYAPKSGCRSDIRAAVGPARRAIMYLGFRFDDVPSGFDGRLLDEMSTFGEIVEYREFDVLGRVVVVDLRPASEGPRAIHQRFNPDDPVLRGCLVVVPARRWS